MDWHICRYYFIISSFLYYYKNSAPEDSEEVIAKIKDKPTLILDDIEVKKENKEDLIIKLAEKTGFMNILFLMTLIPLMFAYFIKYLPEEN